MEGVLEHLLQPDAGPLRHHLVFEIVPMLNPDGSFVFTLDLFNALCVRGSSWEFKMCTQWPGPKSSGWRLLSGFPLIACCSGQTPLVALCLKSTL